MGTNGQKGNGDYFVVEADESDGTFLKYNPYAAIVTNIDNDHLDHYVTEKNLIEAFQEFMEKIHEPSNLFWCGDDPFLVKISPQGHSYGFHESNEYKIENFTQDGWTIRYDLKTPKNSFPNIEVSLSGKHNALNSAAVFALSLQLGIPEQSIRQTFKSFGGIKRRSEKKGEINGVEFFDDYGHHPTEIRATLEAVRRAIGKKRLIVCYQPHRFTRTRDCCGLYGGVFDQADELYITEIYPAGEAPIPGISHELIRQEVPHSHSTPRKELSKSVLKKLLPGDIVISLGAGDITNLWQEMKANSLDVLNKTS